MRYVLLIIFTIFAYKAMEETYDYYFYNAFISDKCAKKYKEALDDKNEPAPLSKRFLCAKDSMGVIEKLSYILARPHFTDISNNGKWYY